MILERPPSSWRLAIVALVVFPLIGPAAVAFTIAGPFAVLALFFLGPGGPLYYLFLGGWWLPALYGLLAAPFLFVGVLVALAGLIFKRNSLLVALLAAELAFSAYFAGWYLVGGLDGVVTITPYYAHLWSAFLTPWLVLPVLVATAGCWFVTRASQRRESQPVADLGHVEPRLRWEAPPMAGAVVLGALGLAAVLWAVLGAINRNPATAWKDCTQGGWEDRMRGCTVIVEHAADEPVDRRVTAYIRRGLAYEELRQDLAKAIADYSEAIHLDPLIAEAYGRRGLAYARRDEDDQAVADLDTALRLDANVLSPDTYRVFRHRGLANFRRREFDRAIADHSEEIRRTPYYADGYLHRAAAHLAKGEIEPAIADFSEAIRIEPGRADGYIERGSVYLTQGDMDRALADFDAAIRRHPDLKLTAPAYRKRGEVLESRGDFAAALAAFETALQLDPSDKDALAGRERMRAALSR